MSIFSWNYLDYPLVLCPPMDGITDRAFREIIAEEGGLPLTYTEFVNVKSIIYQNPKALKDLEFTSNCQTIVQLFGSEPDDFYEAARIVVQMGYRAIDINMGCPAHNVVDKGSGCALMNATDKAYKIVQNTIKGANDALRQLDQNIDQEIEVSCKMRLGVVNDTDVFTHGIKMIEAGAKAIAIHGRTLKQMYTGFANWDRIGEFVKLVRDSYKFSFNRVKIFGSGDVKTLYQAFEKFIKYKVDGVMIGRGSFGNPKVFSKKYIDKLKDFVRKYIDTSYESIPWMELEKELGEYKYSFKELKDYAIRHADLCFKYKGEHGIIQMRKHLGWYFSGLPHAKELRSLLVRVNSLDEIKQILNDYERKYELQG